ncbi:MAG: DOMON-like domain-containing protein [Alphaproteobacteria bacterium]
MEQWYHAAMLHALTRHPDSGGDAVTGVEAEAARDGATLALRYLVTGARALAMPPYAAPARADELWKHTCFEAFVGGVDGGYYEFNFSPSGQWAAYGFTGYRQGMTPAESIAVPHMHARLIDGRYELQAGLTLNRLALPAREWRLGLSAIIEERDGVKSYWALTHPRGKPDFHRSVCFALELPAA